MVTCIRGRDHMQPKSAQTEQILVAEVIAGRAPALDRFLDLASAAIWPVVMLSEGEGAEAEAAFLDVIGALKANNFARLRGFDGRGRLASFLALTTRDVLAEQCARAFAETPDRAWRRFEKLFGGDIRRRVKRRFPLADASQRDDHYQEVCLKLVEDNCRRIRAYSGQGSFNGYILATVERLLIDLMRREAPRRRLPAEVERMSDLHQAMFKAVAWAGAPPDPVRLAEALAGSLTSEPDIHQLRGALDDLAQPIAAARAAALGGELVSLDADAAAPDLLALADPGASAEDQLVADEEERARAAFLESVRRAGLQLPPEDRLYLQIMLEASEPMPPRAIAKVMALPVEEVYRLRQKTQRWLREMASQAANFAEASV